MAFRRIDPLTGRSALIFSGSGKPAIVPRREMPNHQKECPFCYGVSTINRESNSFNDRQLGERKILLETAETLTFANAWPPVGEANDELEEGDIPSLGFAELIITKRHVTSFEELTSSEAQDVIKALEARVNAAKAQKAEKVVSLCAFINVGVQAGQSQSHLHAQMITLDHLAPILEKEMSENCLVCLDAETANKRILLEDGNIKAWVAAAPTLPGEIRVAAKHGESIFSKPSADILRAICTKLSLLNHCAYNIVAHLSADDEALHPHWHILPRLGWPGPFEMGFSMTSTIVNPEDFARQMQK